MLGKPMVKALIHFSQRFRAFRARGLYSGITPSEASQAHEFSRCDVEFNDSQAFLDNFPHLNIPELIRGKSVFDFGSGYGGRTVWLGQFAKEVVGTEIFEKQVEISNRYALARGQTHTKFLLNTEEQLPFADGQFDVLVTYDVMEHVQRPDAILAELYRVLKPGGSALVIFTPYYGIISHHLNYISLWPSLHWFFSPETLIAAVNELATTDPRYIPLHIPPQPAPHWSFNNRRKCLPTLNGITRPEYIDLVKKVGFKISYLHSRPILEKYRALGAVGSFGNSVLNALLPNFLKEYFSHNLVSVLTKEPTVLSGQNG